MANQPKRFCKFANCGKLVIPGNPYCPIHQKIIDKSFRNSFHQRSTDSLYNTTRWRKIRASFLSQHPLCEICKQKGYIVPATEVDHIQPHRGNENLFWNETNLQSLCKSCHSKKTKKEMGSEFQYR